MSLTLRANRNILEMEYAVRGAIPQRAAELKRQGKRIISCNIGNPQALGQLAFGGQALARFEPPIHDGLFELLGDAV